MGLLIDGKHNKTGDETHTGKFKVTADPLDDFDVLRKKDKVEGNIKPYASMVNFWITIPDAWGGAIQPVGIPVANRRAASGSDLAFETDLTMVKLNTAGHYLVLGETYTQYNTYQHDVVIEVWRRPAGTAGASDVIVHSSGMPNNNGGIDKPILAVVSANAGDWIYFKALGKRSYSAEIVVQFLGVQQATAPLTITTPDWSGMAANGQVYPKIITIQNYSQNATGGVAWSITGGTAAGFTTMGAAGLMTLNLPEVGSWTLSLSAVDALGVPATKTINITLAAYAVIPLVITNTTTYNFEADGYPFPVDIGLTSTGGQSPITWSLVVGANTDLPSAAVAGGRLTGSIAAAGTKKAEVRALDSAGSPQDVTKVIYIVVADWTDPGGGGVCFEEGDTFILMADGTGKPMVDVNPGDTVKGVHESSHNRGMRSIVDALVTDKTRVPVEEGAPVSRLVEGISCTQGHPWAVPRDFRRAEAITAGDTILCAGAEGLVEDFTVTKAVNGKKPIRVASTLGTRAGTYFVGKSASGPWFLVHNMSIQTLD